MAVKRKVFKASAKAKPKAKVKPKAKPIAKPKVKAKARAAQKPADTSRELAKKIAEIASDHKAIDIVVLDLRSLTSFADYFVIVSGASDRQVGAIAEAVRQDIKAMGRLPISEEGLRAGHWALLDYGDVILHIFYGEDREYYQLERLWHDAPRVKFSSIG